MTAGIDHEPDPKRPLDARLVPSALGCWGAIALGLVVGWRWEAVAAFGCGALAIVLFCVGRDGRWVLRAAAWTVVGALVLTAGFCIATAWRLHALDEHPLRAPAAAERATELEVVIADDPKLLLGSGFGGVQRVLVQAELAGGRVEGGWTRLGGALVIFAPAQGWAELLPGQRVQVRGRLGPSTRPDFTVAVVQVGDAPTMVAAAPWYQRAAGAVRERFASVAANSLPADQAGLLPGLVVGDTSAVEEETIADFRTAGLSHLTAVSGANITLICGAVLLLVGAMGVGPRGSAVLAGIALVGFVILARPSPSVLRAAVMGAVGLLALMTGRRKQALPALCTAVIVLLAVSPGLAVEAGFALSVIATAGLVVLAPRLADALVARRIPRVIAQLSAVAVAAFLVTAPVVAVMSGSLSVVSILANVLVAPVIGPATVIGAATVVAAVVHAPSAELLVRFTGPELWWLLRVAERAAAVPAASVTVPTGLVGGVLVTSAVCITLMLFRVRPARRVVLAVTVGFVSVWWPARVVMPGWPPANWAVVACDVGQGDAWALAAGDGRAVLVDVGPEPVLVASCLRHLGVSSIAMVVLTHLHDDHIGGLRGVLDNFPVGAVAIGDLHLPAAGFLQVTQQSREAGVGLVGLAVGTGLRIGQLSMQVLGPIGPAPTHVSPDEEDESQVNDASLVLGVDTPAGRVLLTGDVETGGQDRLLRSTVTFDLVQSDIVSLPHHGSSTSTWRFLEAVRPRLVLVSVGADNPYGHPDGALIDRLRATGATVLRTDECGDIAVADGGAGPQTVAEC